MENNNFMSKMKVIQCITDVVCNLITIIGVLYGIAYGAIVKILPYIMPTVNPYISSIAKWLTGHRKEIAYSLVIEAAILLSKYIVLTLFKYNVRRTCNPMREVSYPIKETILLLILMSFYFIFELAVNDKEVLRDYGSKRKGTVIHRVEVAYEGAPIEKSETIDEDEIMMNLIYEMAAEALEGGIINVNEEYDAKYVHERVVVDYYVLECVHRVISVNEWMELSKEELYYIRNGIFAYSGCCFNSGYYDIFLWYEGNIALSDFDYKDFNGCQYKNIMNIVYVEGQRESSQAE